MGDQSREVKEDAMDYKIVKKANNSHLAVVAESWECTSC